MATQDATTAAAPQRSNTAFLNLRTLCLLSVVIGLFISGYLSYSHLTNTATACPGAGSAEVMGRAVNCDAVTNSRYSRMFGIPIAYLGFGMYLTIGAVLLLENRISLLRDYSQEITFGIGLFAWLYSMYLVYLQFFVLQTLCAWCLSHEANMTVLFALLTVRMIRKISKPNAA